MTHPVEALVKALEEIRSWHSELAEATGRACSQEHSARNYARQHVDYINETLAAYRAAEERPHVDDLVEGNDFRTSLISRATMIDASGAPLWHGWALMDAFLAGARHARQELKSSTPSVPESSLEEAHVIGDAIGMLAAYSASIGIGNPAKRDIALLMQKLRALPARSGESRQPEAVPGWQLVPKEPTIEQRKALSSTGRDG